MRYGNVVKEVELKVVRIITGLELHSFKHYLPILARVKHPTKHKPIKEVEVKDILGDASIIQKEHLNW